MKKFLILIFLLSSVIQAQIYLGQTQLSPFVYINADSVYLLNATKLKGGTHYYFGNNAGLRFFNNQLQFSNDLLNWYNIPTSLPQGGGWTLGLNKIYQTTTNTPVHIRSLGSDTTGTGLLNVYGDAYVKGRVIADSGFVVSWSEPQGVIFDGVNDYYSVTNNPYLVFGANDFSIEIFIKPQLTNSYQAVLSKGGWSDDIDYGISIALTSGNRLEVRLNLNGTRNIVSTNRVLQSNVLYHFVVVKTSSNILIYINGKLDRIANIVYQGNNDNGGYCSIGALGLYNMFHTSGIIYLTRLYNRALSQDDVSKLYNNGMPHLAEVPYAERNANQTILSSGTLQFGKRYRIDNYVSGDDFTNVGASSNATGIEFIATGTTPTNWTNGSQLRQIGCVAEYKAENAGTMGWIETQNGLHAVGIGNPIAPVGLRDYKSGVSTTTVQLVNTQKSQTILKQVIVKNNYAGSNTFFLGTTTNANELLNGVSIANGETKVFDVNSYSATERSLYCKAGNSNVDVTLIYEKVAR